MNIDELTYGELKQIAALFGSSVSKNEPHPFVGRYVICRCNNAGVHAGTLVSQDGQRVMLKNARRLWSWKVNDGIALSGLAIHGLAGGKVDTLTPEHYLTDVLETIPCSKKSEVSINDA